ncbi:MAG TPA: MOSC domain-containing protein [Chloroflexi bacterium]|nr:MOSC domain-containing protein [Chloroflexota bacterium]HHW84671.1 MOSC domain-containing protein [Chloroflexota bacterium]
MQLVSVNIGRETVVEHGGFSDLTGILKTPAAGAVEITPWGLTGDAVVDTKHHGGVDQAVYVYGEPEYAWWSAQLGYELAPGTFGENLTVSGLESASLNVGDILHIGAVALQVTAPRFPCATLAARMGDAGFVKRFREAGRPGAYCRVLKAGAVRAGDAVVLERYAGATLSIAEMYREHYNPQPNAETIRRHLAAPIAERVRADIEGKARKAGIA